VPCTHVISCSSPQLVFSDNLSQLGAFSVQVIFPFFSSPIIWNCLYLVLANTTFGIGLKFPYLILLVRDQALAL
jgi:hypothetical protein